jgi:hypothetical protein
MAKRDREHMAHDGVESPLAPTEPSSSATAVAEPSPYPAAAAPAKVYLGTGAVAVNTSLDRMLPPDRWPRPPQPAQQSDVDDELFASMTRPGPATAETESGWGGKVRAFARAAVWAIPLAAIVLTVPFFWGVPRPHHPPSGASPGSWLLVTAIGLALTLVGAIALTALIVSTPGRGWALTGLLCALVGTVVYLPTLGVIALARPAVEHVGDKAAAAFEADLAGGPMLRWLSIGGLVLLSAGWALLGMAILASNALNRADGYLILVAVALAVAAAGFAPALLVISALALLAAGLGLAWTAGRTAPEIS